MFTKIYIRFTPQSACMLVDSHTCEASWPRLLEVGSSSMWFVGCNFESRRIHQIGAYTPQQDTCFHYIAGSVGLEWILNCAWIQYWVTEPI